MESSSYSSNTDPPAPCDRSLTLAAPLSLHKGRLRRIIQRLRNPAQRWGPEYSGWRGERHLFLLALFSALILRLAFPRSNAFPIAAIGLVPLLWAISHARTGKQAFYLGWLFGAVFFYVLLIWLNILVVYSLLITPALILAALYLGLYKGLFAWVMWLAGRRARSSAVIVAAAWVATEYIQSLGDLGLPWGYLGHSLWRHPSLIQLAAWTGVYGLSLVLFWINHLLCDGLRAVRRESDAPPITKLLARTAMIPIFAGVMYLAYHDAVRRTEVEGFYSTKPMTVGIVQPNIAQREKFSSYDRSASEEERSQLQQRILVKTVQLTYQLQNSPAEPRCGLIVWPESALTDDLLTLRYVYYAPFFRDLTTSFGAPLLFGGANVVASRNGKPIAMGEFDSDDYNLNRDLYQFSIFNSAFLAEPDRGLTDRVYNKIHLVPFAEGIPYVQRLKPLVNLISAVVGMLPFGRGTDYTIYDVKGRTSGDGPLRFGVLICYESCYPRLSRRFVRTGAEMLVVITNDAWYETTAGPAQHQMQSVFRAVETRRWIVRCANHGISCFISPLGRIELESGLATEAALRRSVQGVKELTFYARRGDLFGWLALAITIGFIAASAAARQKAKVKRQKSEI